VPRSTEYSGPRWFTAFPSFLSRLRSGLFSENREPVGPGPPMMLSYFTSKKTAAAYSVVEKGADFSVSVNTSPHISWSWMHRFGYAAKPSPLSIALLFLPGATPNDVIRAHIHAAALARKVALLLKSSDFVPPCNSDSSVFLSFSHALIRETYVANVGTSSTHAETSADSSESNQLQPYPDRGDLFIKNLVAQGWSTNPLMFH
jgi:hypothetical protein